MDTLMHQGGTHPTTRDPHDVLAQVGLESSFGPVPAAMLSYSQQRAVARDQRGFASQVLYHVGQMNGDFCFASWENGFQRLVI